VCRYDTLIRKVPVFVEVFAGAHGLPCRDAMTNPSSSVTSASSEVPRDGLAGFLQNSKPDGLAGLLVLEVAQPLCLGISIADADLRWVDPGHCIRRTRGKWQALRAAQA